jgi:hypothetical protein
MIQNPNSSGGKKTSDSMTARTQGFEARTLAGSAAPIRPVAPCVRHAPRLYRGEVHDPGAATVFVPDRHAADHVCCMSSFM